jgi:hypothetical protein
MEKVYKCCICHGILKDEKPIRLLKQIYKAGKYNQFYGVEKYDLCYDCYRKFNHWIQKHKEE